MSFTNLVSMYGNDLALAGDNFQGAEVGMSKILLFYMLMMFYFYQNLQKAYKKVYILKDYCDK